MLFRVRNIAAAFAMLAAAVRAAEEGTQLVVEMVQATFDEQLKGKTWLVEFYGPTCGFCKMIEPVFEQLAKEVAEDEIDMYVGKLNVREATDLSKKYNIGSLPGIKLFRDGQVYTLPNARTPRTPDQYIEYAMETYEAVEKEETDRLAEEARKEAEIYAASDVVHLEIDSWESIIKDEGQAYLIEFYGAQCGYCKKLAPTWELLGTRVNKDPSLDFKVASFDASAGFKYTSAFKANPWPSIKLWRDNKVYTFPDSRNFELTLQDYIDYASKPELYKREADDPFTPDYVQNQIKERKKAERAAGGLERKKAKAAAEAQAAKDAMKPKFKKEL